VIFGCCIEINQKRIQNSKPAILQGYFQLYLSAQKISMLQCKVIKLFDFENLPVEVLSDFRVLN